MSVCVVTLVMLYTVCVLFIQLVMCCMLVYVFVNGCRNWGLL